MAEKRNMNVSITVMLDFQNTPEGWQAVANYSGSSAPAAKPGQTVVDSEGKIDLTAIDRDKSQYTNDTDIWFYLGNAAGDTYNFPYDASDPTNADQALSIEDKKDKNKYTAGLTNNWTLHLLDQDDSGDQASYQLYVMLYPDGGPVGGVKLPIDPIIINRKKTD